MHERQPFDVAAYVHDIATQKCFICSFVSGDPAYFHHRVFEDDDTIIFLSKYPTLAGYCLVCPKAHHEDLTAIPTEIYLALQRKIHWLSRALKQVFQQSAFMCFRSAASRPIAISISTSCRFRKVCPSKTSNITP